MTRISSILLIIAAVLAAALLGGGAGCSSGYERHDVGVDSVEGKAVKKMLAELRGGAAQVDKFIETHGAAGLTPSQATGLKNMLTQFAAAPKLRLVSIDRFGNNIFRAGITMSDAKTSPIIFVLLVANDGELRWAGAN